MDHLPTLAFALTLAAAPVWSDNHNTPTPMTTSCNANGAVIDVTGGPTFYLGNSCDAAMKNGGTGKWWYAAAAFLIEIDGKTWRFANNPNCPTLSYCNYTDRP